MSATQEEYDALREAYLRAVRLAARQAERADLAEARLAVAAQMLKFAGGRDSLTDEEQAAREEEYAAANPRPRRPRSAENQECGV